MHVKESAQIGNDVRTRRSWSVENFDFKNIIVSFVETNVTNPAEKKTFEKRDPAYN